MFDSFVVLVCHSRAEEDYTNCELNGGGSPRTFSNSSNVAVHYIIIYINTCYEYINDGVHAHHVVHNNNKNILFLFEVFKSTNLHIVSLHIFFLVSVLKLEMASQYSEILGSHMLQCLVLRCHASTFSPAEVS